jgi:hypothetical protein
VGGATVVLLQCVWNETTGVSALTPTRNKPSFTPQQRRGMDEVRPTLLQSCALVRVPGDRAGARTERRYYKP